MGRKEVAERKNEMLATIRTIINAKCNNQGSAAKNLAEAWLGVQGDQEDAVIKKMHLGKKGGLNKAARDGIRAAMLLAWTISETREYALEMKEFLKALNRPEIENHIAKLWKYRIEPRADEVQLINSFTRKITLLEQEPLEFLKRYSLGPLGQLPSPGGVLDQPFALEPIANPIHPIQIMKFNTLHRQVATPFPFMLDKLEIAPGPLRAYAKRFYFLPWKSHRITRLQIPGPPHPPQTPSLFATAFLKGCSVFIQPPLTSPTIYHAGIEGVVRDISDDLLPDGANLRTRSARTQNKANSFWRELLMDLTNRIPRSLQGVGEVNKEMYSNNKREEIFLGRMRMALQRRGKSVDQFNQWGQSFGCIFGKREGFNWTFYLQQNILLKYTSTDNNDITTMVPIYVMRVFPAATIWDGLLQKLPDNVNDPHLEWQS